MNPRRKVNPDKLKHLYVNEAQPIDRVALRLGGSATTIRRRLAEFGIVTRRRGPQPDPLLHASRREWSPALGYAVGLIAADGNLSKDGRHITLTSADHDLLVTFCACLGVENQVCLQSQRRRACYRVQRSDRALYAWLLDIGLMPAKSLRLGALKIPDEYFADFVRGCLDGDGTIQTYTDRSNTLRNKKYVYARLSVRFTSASLSFLKWLHANLVRMLNTRGSIIAAKPRAGRAPDWNLKLAHRDSIRLFRWLYYAADVPCLARKREQAAPFLTQSAIPHAR